jgi:protein-tyrosine phosphatase
LPTETASPSGTPQIETSDTWVDLQSIQNARQLGGYLTENNHVVKANVILRSGELALLSNMDRDLLVNKYELAHIVDLRDEVEVEDNPDPVIEGVQYHHFIVWPREVRLRLIEESTTARGFDGELYIQKYYTAFALGSDAVEAYRKMFEVLLENDGGSILIHCLHGRDRSGIAATLILCALGVAWEDIEREYLLSGKNGEGMNISSLRFYKSVIEEKYGNIEKYLAIEMNLDENDFAVLREKYTVQ